MTRAGRARHRKLLRQQARRQRAGIAVNMAQRHHPHHEGIDIEAIQQVADPRQIAGAGDVAERLVPFA